MLEIGNPVPLPFPNQFVCEVDLEWAGYGDRQTISVPVRSERAQALHGILKRVHRYDIANLAKIPGIEEFFGRDGNHLETWPWDYYVQEHWQYLEHRFYWYSPEGVKYHATLIEDEIDNDVKI